MAHQGGVVTQSLTQISERGNPNNLDDAAHIARIWLNMPPTNHVQVQKPLDDHAQAQTPPEGPTSAAHHRQLPAADQTSTPTNHHLSAPNDRNAYSQLQSPLFGKLPAELRLQVWEHLLTPTAHIDRPTVAVNVLETCRRAYDETKLLVYQQNQVRVHLLQSPLPGSPQHWTRLLAPAQQAATHLNLYVQPGTATAYGWNLLRWTKKLDVFRPRTLQLTVWFTSSVGWWNYYVKDMLKNLRGMRGVRTCVLEFRVARDRFRDFDKRAHELCAQDIKLADGCTLACDGGPPEYWEGSEAMMDHAFGRVTHLADDEQPRWMPCQDPEKAARGETVAIVVKWRAAGDGPA